MEIAALGLFILSFIGGQITALSITPTIRISLIDISVFLLLLLNINKFNNIKKFVLLPAITIFAIVSVRNDISILYTFRWLLYAGLYVIAASQTYSPKQWSMVLLTSGIGIAVLGFVQFFLYPDLRNLYYLGWDPHLGRLFSTFLDPNLAGIILVCTTLMLVKELFERKISVLHFVLFTVSFISLLLTFSRSSYLAFFAGMIVLGLLLKKIKFTILLIAISLLAFYFIPKVGEGQNILRTVSSLARFDSINRGITLFLQHPLFGIGFGDHSIDSSFLYILVSTGIVGFAAFLWIYVKIFTIALKNKSATLLATLSAVFVHSLFVNSLVYPWVAAWLWILTGTQERKIRGYR